MQGRAILLVMLLLTLAGAGLAIHRKWVEIPPEWNPWQPLDIAAQPNFLTRFKLDRLTGDAGRCRAVLGATSMEFDRLTARDWEGEDDAAAFLHQVRSGACRFFDGVLSPDYNAAHHDHLHLDRGSFRLCR